MEAAAHPLTVEGSSLSPASLFGDLRLLKLRFFFKVSPGGKERLPPYLGSAWRGLLGWSMKALACPGDPEAACGGCAGRDCCPYFLLFERKSILPGCDESPRGYIFYPPPGGSGGARESLEATLMGPYTRYAPLLIKAMAAGRKIGLGADRIPYRITGLEEVRPGGEAAALSPEPGALASLRHGHPLREWLRRGDTPAGGRFTATIVSPVRLRRKGAYLREMDWPFFLSTLFRRLEAASRLFCDAPPLGRDLWLRLQEMAESPGVTWCRLRWSDLARYSNRQARHVPMGGLVGTCEVEDPDGSRFPWWQAASLLHVGKGASMGLGGVEV